MNKESKRSKKETTRTPLFTGDYKRDATVSEMEKAAEASYAIREALMKLGEKKSKCGK